MSVYIDDDYNDHEESSRAQGTYASETNAVSKQGSTVSPLSSTVTLLRVSECVSLFSYCHLWLWHGTVESCTCISSKLTM